MKAAVASADRVAHAIDESMERASAALVRTEYFDCERHAARALARSFERRDYERMARILMPLQEARRQVRQLAVDAGCAGVFDDLRKPARALKPGCVLLKPPVIGAEACGLRELAARRKVPVFILTREPLTLDGLWPIVGVARWVSVRTKVKPPWPIARDESSPAKDADFRPPPAEWFEAVGEALGDSALARLKPEDPAAWRVADLMEFLDACPDHEKLHQRLADECRKAITEPAPTRERRRPRVIDETGF